MAALTKPSAGRAQRLQDIAAAHKAWVGEAIAMSTFEPEDRKTPSDYNLHYADLGSDGVMEDRLAALVAAPEVAAVSTPPGVMPTSAELVAYLEYEEAVATAVPGAHFHTLMHTEGVSTGRRVQMPGSWTWRTPPIPFNWETRTAMHGGVPEVVTVGLVTDIARTGREIHGWGMIDLDDPNGLEYARKLAEGWVRGVSVGPDEQPMDMELIYSPTDPETVIQEVFHSGNIYEVTSSGGVAQATAYVEPLPALIAALAERGIEVASADDETGYVFAERKHPRDRKGKFADKAAPTAAEVAKAVQRLKNAEIMFGEDRKKWPKKAQADALKLDAILARSNSPQPRAPQKKTPAKKPLKAETAGAGDDCGCSAVS
jgi:hypothetical protein